MEKQKITKLKEAVPVFRREGLEWQTVELPRATAEIHQALGDPARSTIFELLKEGPIRQIDLARLLSEALGRRLDVSTIKHHLNLLKKARLIDYEELRRGKVKVKMIYRAADVELRMREIPKPEIAPPTSPKSIEEWLAGLRKRSG